MTKSGRSGQALARRRGKEFEKKVARLLEGHVHLGQDGDVKAGQWMVEAKYRSGLKFHGPDELRSFLEQVNRYVETRWPKGQRWILAITGGRYAPFPKLSKSGTFVLMSVEEYKRLRDIDDAHS